MIPIGERDGVPTFAVRASARSGRDAIKGEHGGALKVKLVAPALEGRANESLRPVMAGRLAVPVSAVRILTGEKSRRKRVSIAGVTREQLAALTQSGAK